MHNLDDNGNGPIVGVGVVFGGLVGLVGFLVGVVFGGFEVGVIGGLVGGIFGVIIGDSIEKVSR